MCWHCYKGGCILLVHNFFVHLFTSFIASACFGIIFNAPRKSLIQCGFVGSVGWIIYIYLVTYHTNAVVASLAGAVVIAIISHYCARRYKTPMIIYSVAGIIPLVPGGLAYDAMRNFVENDYSTAISLAAKAMMIAGAIAVGIVISEVIFQVFMKLRYHLANK